MTTKQSQFLQIKQRLDHYAVPTNFHIDDTELLKKLLSKLDQSQAAMHATIGVKQKRNIVNPKSKLTDPIANNNKDNDFKAPPPHQPHYSDLDMALRRQMTKTIHESNQLHLQVISLKQQLQTANHCLDKLMIDKSSEGKAEMTLLMRMRNERQKQIIEELQLAKFKYNELLELINQQDNLERKYIKRLFNHKKYGIKDVEGNEEDLNRDNNNIGVSSNSVLKSNNRAKRKRLNNSQISGQRRKNGTKGYTEISAENQNPHLNPVDPNNAAFLLQLQTKLKLRSQEISRLHAKLQYNGLNLNGILSSYQQDKAAEKLSLLQYRIDLLSDQNSKMKKQLDRSRKTAGRYEALRVQLEKCYAKIAQLKQKSKMASKLVKEVKFDCQKDQKKMERDAKQLESSKECMRLKRQQDQRTISVLKKKVQFFEREFYGESSTNSVINNNRGKAVKSKPQCFSNKNPNFQSHSKKSSSKSALSSSNKRHIYSFGKSHQSVQSSSKRPHSSSHNKSKLVQISQQPVLQSGGYSIPSVDKRQKQTNTKSNEQKNNADNYEEAHNNGLKIQQQAGETEWAARQRHPFPVDYYEDEDLDQDQEEQDEQQKQDQQNNDGSYQQDQMDPGSQNEQYQQYNNASSAYQSNILQQQKKALNRQLSKKNQQIILKDQSIRNLEQIVDQLMKQRSMSNGKNNNDDPSSGSSAIIQNLTKMNESLSNQLSHHKTLLKQYTKQLDQLQQQHQRSKHTIAELQELLNDQDTQKSAIKQQLKQVQEFLKRHKHHQQQQQLQIKQLTEDLRKRQVKIEEIATLNQRQYQEYSRQIARLQAQLKTQELHWQQREQYYERCLAEAQSQMGSPYRRTD